MVWFKCPIEINGGSKSELPLTKSTIFEFTPRLMSYQIVLLWLVSHDVRLRQEFCSVSVFAKLAAAAAKRRFFEHCRKPINCNEGSPSKFCNSRSKGFISPPLFQWLELPPVKLDSLCLNSIIVLLNYRKNARRNPIPLSELPANVGRLGHPNSRRREVLHLAAQAPSPQSDPFKYPAVFTLVRTHPPQSCLLPAQNPALGFRRLWDLAGD